MIRLFQKAHLGGATLAVLAVLAAAACDKSSTGPEPQATTTIELRNDANVAIVSVHIAKCSDAEWGVNRLNPNETIATGAIRSWSMAPGCYDVRASTGAKFGTWFDQEATAGGFVRLALPASAGS